MVGREREVQKLLELYDREKADFVAIFGRRRVGKTYLVDVTFRGKITFRHAGLSPVDEEQNERSTNDQLTHFYYSLLNHGAKADHCPSNWLEAFYMLESWLQKIDDGKKQLVFLDELPWMDTKKSGFITALEGFWNTWGCCRKNLMLIVCGSATSWMKNRLINNHGGLYNRVTYEIKLSPFTLRECDLFLKEKQINYSRYDIVQSYMIFGGIPYYLDYHDKNLSLAQNVDRLFFGKNAVLRFEYDRLFSSIFNHPSLMKEIAKFLYTRNAGYTRKEISEKLQISSGGTLSSHLDALITSDFVIKYVPFGKKGNEVHYKLVDPFCMFYLHFLEGRTVSDHDFWLHNQNSPSLNAWRGFSFENVCFNHIDEIKRALGISGVNTKHSAWSKRSDDANGTQINLLLERDDHVVNDCEIKFYSSELSVDKSYDLVLRNRMAILARYLSPKVTIYNTLITTYGLKRNEYSGIFNQVVTMDDLF